MPFNELPLAPTPHIRVRRIPLLRFVGFGLLSTLVHLVVSAILIGGWFGYGMAAGGFNGHQYIGPSNCFLELFNVWNAGYVYIWNPLKEKVLPSYPPYQEPPSGDAPGPYVKYHPYEMETVRIHKIKTTWEVIAFLSWASACGFSITFIRLGWLEWMRDG